MSNNYQSTIDWDEYWTGADEAVREDTSPSADLVLEPFLEFLNETISGGPDSYADVGCGPGDLVFEVARRYPDATVLGFDAAEPVLEDNRARADSAGVDVAFEQAVLPAFSPDRQFDVVSCLFTLCYVSDIERALATLYDAVAPGGALVLHYHNELARSQYRRIADSPAEYLDDESVWDPETFADRFELVITGESLSSYERIHEVLGTWPQSLFSISDSVEPYDAHRHEPLVYVPK